MVSRRHIRQQQLSEFTYAFELRVKININATFVFTEIRLKFLKSAGGATLSIKHSLQWTSFNQRALPYIGDSDPLRNILNILSENVGTAKMTLKIEVNIELPS